MKKIVKKWTMKDGSKIRICDMDNEHLNNTIKMLQRVAKRNMNIAHKSFLSIPYPIGEKAGYDYDNCLNQIFEETWEDYVADIYYDLESESLRRGITK